MTLEVIPPVATHTLADDALPIVFVLLDGLGDLPGADGRTASEAARTPVLDRLAARGTCGVHVPFGPGRATSSERAHWAMFGLSDVPFVGRAALELAGVGLPVPEHVPMWHLALRKGEVRDGRMWMTGRAARSDQAIADALGQKIIRSAASREHHGVRFALIPLRCAEWVLVGHGATSHEASDTDPLFDHVHPWMQPLPLAEAVAAGGTRAREAARTAAALQSFLLDARDCIAGEAFDVPTTKWASYVTGVPSFLDVVGVPGAMVTSSAMYRGVGRLLSMDVIDLPLDLARPGEDIAARLEAARGRPGFVHVHTKATDEAGHTKNQAYKSAVIEALDAGLEGLLDLADSAIVAVTGDHATPASTSMLHSGDPSPLVVAGPGIRADAVKEFGERSCRQGDVGRLSASELMPLLLGAARRSCFLGHRPGGFATLALPVDPPPMPLTPGSAKWTSPD